MPNNTDMLGRIVLRLTWLYDARASELVGPIDDFLIKLHSGDFDNWMNEFKKFLRKEPCWEKCEEVKKSNSLQVAAKQFLKDAQYM